ncbi:lasso peptide biosynthesis PqqD family chaperone [Nonomuraea sp. NPDC003560]|uniref:lasso peptide biosynthesis PqqD family chaperone n=1 Tax=Nonomuraea sp. NPDC003560 TaxID=3364341 RepID=UPI0036CD3EFF
MRPPRLLPDVASCDTDDGLVLLDTRTGRYFQLNITAAAVLRALLAGTPATEIADQIAATRPVTLQQAQADITALIDHLTQARLLAISDTARNTRSGTP